MIENCRFQECVIALQKINISTDKTKIQLGFARNQFRCNQNHGLLTEWIKCTHVVFFSNFLKLVYKAIIEQVNKNNFQNGLISKIQKKCIEHFVIKN